MEAHADPTMRDERLKVIFTERAATCGVRQIRRQGKPQRRAVLHAVVRDTMHGRIAHAYHVAAALEHADPRREVVRIVRRQVEPGERTIIVELAAEIDRRRLGDGTDGGLRQPRIVRAGDLD